MKENGSALDVAALFLSTMRLCCSMDANQPRYLSSLYCGNKAAARAR